MVVSKRESYIRVIDWLAEQTAENFRTTGRMTVVVQDNGSLHTSHLTRQQWQRWFAQGLFLFFLSPYCSEMNRIEDQWHQLKTHEIAGQMFEDEYDERPCNYAWNESSEFQRWLPTGTLY